MRTVTYGAACSLDGFITAADGSLDWLHFSNDVQQIMGDYWATIDTVLMGRKTWEVSVATSGGRKKASPKPKTKPRKPHKPAITTYVFSRTLRPDDVDGAELVSDGAGDFVRALKRQPGKGICVMGGGILATSLLEAGVIDEVGLNAHPILLGAGIPLFGDPGRRVPLELRESRVLDGGCVYSIYRVCPPSS